MSLTGQLYEEMQQDFINSCEQVENGYLTALDCAVKFKNEMDALQEVIDYRKGWLSQEMDAVTNEAEQYGKEGYKGLVFKKQYRETLSYDEIPEWVEVQERRKEIEARSKNAHKQLQNGMLNVDKDGEEIPLPKVKTSTFIKIEKTK